MIFRTPLWSYRSLVCYNITQISSFFRFFHWFSFFSFLFVSTFEDEKVYLIEQINWDTSPPISSKYLGSFFSWSDKHTIHSCVGQQPRHQQYQEHHHHNICIHITTIRKRLLISFVNFDGITHLINKCVELIF